MKKITIFCFAVFMLLCMAIITGCNSDDSENPVIEDQLSGVYRSKTVEFPEGVEPNLFFAPVYSDGSYTVEAYFEGKKVYYTFDQNGENAAELDENTGLAGVEAHNDGARVLDEYNFDDFKVHTEMLSTDISMDLYLTLRGKKNNVLFSADIPEIFDYDMNRDLENYAGDIFTVIDVAMTEHNEQNIIIVLTTEGLCALDESGTLLWINDKQHVPTAMALTDVGLIYLYSDKSGVQSLKIVNLADGTLGDSVEMPESISNAGGIDLDFYIGEGFDFYVKNRLALWGVTLENAEDGSIVCVPTEVVNWLNSDIASSDVYQLCVVNPQTIAATCVDMLSVGGKRNKNTVVLFTMVPEDEITEKQIIKVADLSGDYYLQYAVKKFNKSSDTHRIVVDDYIQYDWESRKLRLDTEIAAGRTPDIVMYGLHSSLDSVLDSYIRSGLFADLTPLLKADETFNYDDLLGSVTNPYIYYKGEQNIFPVRGAYFSTYIGKASNFDGVMTPEETVDMMKNLPDGKLLYANEANLKFDIRYASLGNFIDYDNASCNIDSEEFLKLYKLTDGLDYGKAEYEKSSELIDLFSKGNIMLYGTTINNLYNWAKLKAQTGDDLVNVGYPSINGEVIVDNSLNDYFAITKTSKYKEYAVDLLELLIEITSNSDDYYSAVSFYKSDIDKQFELFDGQTIVIDGRSIRLANDSDAEALPGLHIKVTKEDAEDFKAFLDNVDKRIRWDSPAVQIFQDELLLNNYPTPEELLKVAQSRISIMLSEQFG